MHRFALIFCEDNGLTFNCCVKPDEIMLNYYLSVIVSERLQKTNTPTYTTTQLHTHMPLEIAL